MYYLAIITSSGGPGDGDYLARHAPQGSVFYGHNKQIDPLKNTLQSLSGADLGTVITT